MRFRVAILLGALCVGLIALAMMLGHRLPNTKFVFSAYCNDSEVYLADWPHFAVVNLSRDAASYDYGPAWSPDGQQIAFTSYSSEADIFITELFVDSFRNLTHSHDIQAARPAWSPDGHSIAFISESPTSLAHISVVNITTGKIRDFPSARVGTFGYAPVWSPDGRHLAFLGLGGESFYEIFVLDITINELRNVSSPRQTADGFPSWSPDGKRLTFAAYEGLQGQVYMTDIATGVTTRLTNNAPANFSGTAWLPHGQQLAAITNRAEVNLLDLTGTITHRFDLPQMLGLMQPVNAVGAIVVSPEGDYLAVQIGVGGRLGNYLINIATGTVSAHLLPTCGSDVVAWAPR